MFPGHTVVRGRQVVLHHQSAGAAEYECMSYNFSDRIEDSSVITFPDALIQSEAAKYAYYMN